MVESLTQLFNSVAEMFKDYHTIFLLRLLCLIHFLRKDSKPNTSVPLTSKWREWEDPYLKIESVYRTMESKHGYVTNYFLASF